MTERRRLPVIQSAPPSKEEKSGGDDADDEGESRPPWQWIGFGTVVTFALWLPLAYVAAAVSHSIFVSRFGESATRVDIDLAFQAMSAGERFRWTAMQTVPHVIAFALAAFAGGMLVGRFGTGKDARENQKLAALSGVVTSAIALVISWRVLSEGGWGTLVTMIVPLVLAVGFGWWGGRVGSRKPQKALKSG